MTYPVLYSQIMSKQLPHNVLLPIEPSDDGNDEAAANDEGNAAAASSDDYFRRHILVQSVHALTSDTLGAAGADVAGCCLV